MNTQKPDLRTAAQAVIDRWETPLWKDAPATAGYIAALRDALAADRAMRAAQPAEAQQSVAANAESGPDMRALVAVAVTMLFDSHPDDVQRVFTIEQLTEIARTSEKLGCQQVEDIYKSAWDALDCSSLTAAASARQPGTAYAALPEPHHRGPEATGNYFSSFTADQMRAYADATCAIRASHAQAPAQAAPAAVVGMRVTDAMALAFHSALSDGAIGADEVEDIKTGLRAALAAAPTTQPAAAPGVQWQCGPQANGFMTPQADSGAAPLPAYPPLPDLDGTLWLAIGQHRRAITHLETTLAAKAVDTAVCGLLRAYVDADRALRASRWQAPAGAAPATQPSPQQEAQEPVAWQSRTRPTWGGNDRPWSPWEPCTKGLAEDCWKTPLLHDWAYEARALYTAPQPSPAAQEDAQDAARLDWLENDVGCRVFHLGKSWYTRANFGMPYRKRASLREAIDAARAAQEGK